MSTTITCPLCSASVELRPGEAEAICEDAHDLSADELGAEVQRRVERALWAAVRALDDQAAYARWAEQNGKKVPPGADRAAQDTTLLRSILSRPATGAPPS